MATSGGIATDTYDALDRLASVVHPGGGTTSYAYGAAASLVERTGPGGTQRFLVDPLSPTGEAQVLDERDGAGGLMAVYTYWLALLSRSRGGRALLRPP